MKCPLLLRFLFGVAATVGTAPMTTAADPSPAAQTLPLGKVHALEMIVMRKEGTWMKSSTTSKPVLRDLRALVYPTPDLSGVTLPKGPVELTLVLNVTSVGTNDAGPEAGQAATDLPLRLCFLSDADWQKGKDHQLPREYQENNGFNILAETPVNPETTRGGDELRLSWVIPAEEVPSRLANGLLLYLDIRDRSPGMKVVTSLAFADSPRVEIRETAR